MFIIYNMGNSLSAQIGGTSTYSFLNITNSSRVAALGGQTICIDDNDLNLVYHNPALLNSHMDGDLALNYINYFTDINYGYLSYAQNFDNIGLLSGGIHYINYGTFTEADENGVITSEFKAAEYALLISYAKPLFDSLFTLGITVKPILSTFEKYTSFGIAADIGAKYTNKEGLFTAGLVIRNLGIQLVQYTDERETLPLTIQLGISQKLKHAPFRFVLVADQLQQFDLTYSDPLDNATIDPITGEEVSESLVDQYADMIMRHLIIGLEFIPLDNLFIRAGYNYRQRQELKIDTKTSTVGFSWGFGIKISRFTIDYGRARYHLAGATNHISIKTNLNSFYKKR